MWFVNDNIVAFIISNYIALHNITRETTKYVGINKVVGEITSFYICPNKEKTADLADQSQASLDDDKDETHLIGYAEAPWEIKKRIQDYPYAEIKAGADAEEIDRALGVREVTEYESDLYIFKLNNTEEQYVLTHSFSEPHDIVMMQIWTKENLAYTLSNNKKSKSQKFCIWNYKKELWIL